LARTNRERRTCLVSGCQGAQLHDLEHCFAHAYKIHPDTALWNQLHNEGAIDLHGVSIDAELVEHILSTAQRDGRNRALLHIDFSGSIFSEAAAFESTVFTVGTSFAGAKFIGAATFTRCTFHDSVSFVRTDFRDQADFGGTTFREEADFTGAVFAGKTDFSTIAFRGDTIYTGATFFEETAFGHTRFGKRATFIAARFKSDVWFDYTQFTGSILDLELVSFERPVSMNVGTEQFSCRWTRFTHGAEIAIKRAQIILDGAAFGAPSILTGSVNRRSEGAPTNYGPQQQSLPRLLSLRQADLSNLVLSNFDLRACLFSGAHNLDKLRFEGTIYFADTPRGLQKGRTFPFIWWWTRRRTISEEQEWRKRQRRGMNWYPPECRSRVAHPGQHLDPPGISQVYRDLRRSYEDQKYEPGAADFYYGEMEMRRRSAKPLSGEGFVIWLYWVFSGYALRASRALFALLTLLVLATVLIANFGLPSRPAREPEANNEINIRNNQPSNVVDATSTPVHQPFLTRLGTAWWVALEGAVFRSSNQQLTPAGQHIQTLVRLFGPILLGLALLSVRGRVKR
jgi:uncharacterized protein YjbI with pentapeptide repeats